MHAGPVSDSTLRRRPRASLGWLAAGSAAAMTSTVVMSLCGWCESRNAVAPNNGPSQWIWGSASARRRHFSFRRTLAAYVIHHCSSLLWSRVHQGLFVREPRPQTLPRRVAEGAAIAALACFVDYRCTPRRFRPGFEQHLSRTSLLLVYAGFGAALGVTTHLLTREKRRWNT